MHPPATTLTDNCYGKSPMDGSSRNHIKALFTTEPGTSHTSNWLYGVPSTGTFVKNRNATWNVTGSDGIPKKRTTTTE